MYRKEGTCLIAGPVVRNPDLRDLPLPWAMRPGFLWASMLILRTLSSMLAITDFPHHCVKTRSGQVLVANQVAPRRGAWQGVRQQAGGTSGTLYQ